MRFIRYLGQTLLSVYYDTTQLILINALWVLMTLPIITAPGALVGLFYATNKLFKNEPVDRRIFITCFKKYFWVSWQWTLLNLGVFFVGYLNFDFYRKFEGGNTHWAVGIVIGLIFIWTIIQIFFWPLLIEQAEPKILSTIRKCVVLVFSHPGPIFFIAILLFMLSLISVWLIGLPWLIFMGSLSAYLITSTIAYIFGNNASFHRH